MGWRTAANATIFKDQLKARIKNSLGASEAKGDLLTFIDYYLDDSIRAIAGGHTWSWRRLAAENLHTSGSAVSNVTIPAYVDRYADVVLYQIQAQSYEDGHKHKPLEYIPPWEYARRSTQGASAVDEVEAFTVIEDKFELYPTIKATGGTITILAYVLSDQLDDDGTVVGLWRRIPANFLKVLEWEALHGMENLEKNEVWGERVWGEKGAMRLLIAEDKTAFKGGGV